MIGGQNGKNKDSNLSQISFTNQFLLCQQTTKSMRSMINMFTNPITQANVKLIFSKLVLRGLNFHSYKVDAINGANVSMKNKKVPE